MITPRGLCLLAETACNPVIAQFVNIESYSTSGVQLSFQKNGRFPIANDYWHKRQLSLGIICKTESEIQKPFSFLFIYFFL